ncbi:MAG: hypothetical protein ACQERN_03370 [Thermodesulfobacteriota bacterium]
MKNNIFYNSIETGRTCIETAFDTGAKVQDQSEQMFRQFIDQAPWLDENAKKSVDIWFGACKQGRDTVKKVIDENLNGIEKMFPAS